MHLISHKGANAMELSCTTTKQRGVAPSARRLLVGLVAVFITAAAPAWAAQVVDVRVGKHAGFSRVVFELDSPVGYKVERNAPAAGIHELVISLDAAAKAQTLERDLDFIERVEIVPGAGNQSTVRIRLKGDGLKLKEMILASPPRIVLDVLDEQAAARAAAQAKATARKQVQKQAAASKKAKAEAKKALETAKAREAAEAAQAKADAMAAVPQPPTSMPPGSANTAGNAAAVPPTNITRSAARPPRPTAADMPAAVIPSPNAAKPIRPAPKPAATARPMATPPKPAAVAPPSDEGLFTMTNLAVGGVGLVLLAGAGFVVMRRRNAAEVVDVSAFENPLGDDNPFAGLDPEVDAEVSAEVEAETEELPISEAARAEVGIPIPEPATDSREGTDMDMVSDNSQTTVLNTPPMGGMAGGDDTARMVAEFERRMAAMETRIDELVDAKERLERQVAAQTEELRVQRAAIARTQRAVRNLGRPGEDSPTEPALRDPSRPEGPRE